MSPLFAIPQMCHATAHGARDNEFIYGIVIGIRINFYDLMTRDGTCKRVDHNSHPSETFLENAPKLLHNVK